MRLKLQMIAMFALVFTLSLHIASSQSSTSVDTASVPPHSGQVSGQSGPKAGSPPPPARPSSNPVNNDEANSAKRSFVGVVSDSYCGKEHYMLSGANDSECTRYCIAHQRSYVLVVGDKLYSLQNQPGHVLDALAGKKARVTGALMGGDILEVDSAAPIQTR